MRTCALMLKWIACGLVTALLAGCEARQGLAPVVDANGREQPRLLKAYPPGARHVVRRGETLYSISFRYDQDYQTLASQNGIAWPYVLQVGQVLYLKSMPRDIPRLTNKYTLVSPAKKTSTVRRDLSSRPVLMRPTAQARGAWFWPAQGRIMTTFSPERGRKGIDISGKKGQAIHAVSSGVVAYAGNGLSGYGNLIIIKHNQQLMTAYGNNMQNKVHEGQQVVAGQIIATMGAIERRYWGVHFEVRKGGIPVNPLHYLKKG